MSNAPSKPVSFSRPKVGYFSNRPRSTTTGCCINIVWIANVAQDAVHGRTVLNTVINLQIS